MGDASAIGGGMLGWLTVLLVLGLWMLGAYNRLTALRAAVLAAWTPLEAALQARAQAFDRLLQLAAGPLQDERAALDTVAAAQAQVAAALEPMGKRPVVQAGVAELAKADAVLAAVSQRLLALLAQDAALRDQPEVTAQLQVLRDLKPRLQFTRQAFNEAVNAYNVALAQFPTRLLGPVFRFEPGGLL
jgi:LemA protein